MLRLNGCFKGHGQQGPTIAHILSTERIGHEHFSSASQWPGRTPMYSPSSRPLSAARSCVRPGHQPPLVCRGSRFQGFILHRGKLRHREVNGMCSAKKGPPRLLTLSLQHIQFAGGKRKHVQLHLPADRSGQDGTGIILVGLVLRDPIPC